MSDSQRIAELEERCAKLKSDVQNALYFRASTVWFLFDELRKEIGFEKTREVLKRGFFRLGQHSGRHAFAAADVSLPKLCNRFRTVDEDGVFSFRFMREDKEAVDVQAMTCPLKDGIKKLGVSDTELGQICEIADAMTYGMMDSANLDYSSETWRPGDPEGCCIMHIRPKAPKKTGAW